MNKASSKLLMGSAAPGSSSVSGSAFRSAPNIPGRSVQRWLSSAFMSILLMACSTTSQPGYAADEQPGSTPTTAASTATGTKNAYLISPEDVLEVSVWREAELQRKLVVRPDGGISFPLIGNVQAAGKSAEQLEATITDGLKAYIPDAVVTVSVAEIKGLKIFVTGQVKQPGQFLVGRYVDVLQALTLAGGLTPFADRRNIRILRRSENSETVFKFDYNAVHKGQSLTQNILLKPGDTVVVP